MQLTKDQLKACMPAATPANIDLYLPHINETLNKYQINTPVRAANFIAQLAHECMQLNAMVENLNYTTASRLVQIFPKYFKTLEQATPYVKQPEKLANRVYGNRYGNGPETSGDGWRYRGRGPVHLTFKDNYRAAGAAVGHDLVAKPDDAANPKYSMLIAGWYWDSRKLNSLADKNDFKGTTKAINGGFNGLKDRLEHWYRCQKALEITNINYIEA